MGHSVVTHERINKQLNYEGYGPVRYHIRRLPVEHDRSSANLPPGPPDSRHLHHCRHPHRCSRPRRSRCQEAGSAQDPGSSTEPIRLDGIFLFKIPSFKYQMKKQVTKKKKKKKKFKMTKKKKKKKKKKKS